MTFMEERNWALLKNELKANIKMSHCFADIDGKLQDKHKLLKRVISCFSRPIWILHVKNCVKPAFF